MGRDPTYSAVNWLKQMSSVPRILSLTPRRAHGRGKRSSEGMGIMTDVLKKETDPRTELGSTRHRESGR